MSNLSRRNVLSLGVALGLAGVAGRPPPLAWHRQPRPAPVGADPWWAWDDEIDGLMAGFSTTARFRRSTPR